MYSLWSSPIVGHLSSSRIEDDANIEAILAALVENGLGLQIGANMAMRVVDAEQSYSSLGGAENRQNQATTMAWLGQLKNTAEMLVGSQFRNRIREYVQADNRSVQSALRNIPPTDIRQQFDFITKFVGKDIKQPIRYHTILPDTVNYGEDPELIYSEEQTGTFHTLQRIGNAETWRTWGMYIEDTPASRRYIRYVDFKARQAGMRVVYCPKTVNHLDEISNPARPSWDLQGDRVQRSFQDGSIRLLYVALAFDYSVFRGLTTLETTVQPGQTSPDASRVSFSPIFVDNIDYVIRVLSTLGGFSLCKIFYKGFRDSRRSSPPVQ